jgi:cysteine desulfurase
VYLDYNATAPVWPEAVEAAAEALRGLGNPSAVHEEGRAARAMIEAARERVAAHLGARPKAVVFTSGGTEANMLALRGLAESGAVSRIAVSAIEHPSVLEAARATGLPVEILPVTPDGLVEVEAVEKLAAPGLLISVMSANNETGVIQPIAEIRAIAEAKGAFLHVDAVQSAGRVALRFESDLMTVSAHKLGGPMGMGALLIADRVPLAAQIQGGGQERRRRAGTENVAGIAGFAAAMDKLPLILADQERIAALRDRLEAGVLALAPDAVFFGARAARLANTSSFATPGLAAALQIIALDLSGIAVSAGSACSSGKVERSPVLAAMGAGALAGEAIRVSLGWTSRTEDIDAFLDAYGALLTTHRALGRRAYGT